MILTVDDNFDKSSGKKLPMFSRTGKQTTNMYIAFADNKPDALYQSGKDEEDNDDDINLNKEEFNLMTELQKIRNYY